MVERFGGCAGSVCAVGAQRSFDNPNGGVENP